MYQFTSQSIRTSYLLILAWLILFLAIIPIHQQLSTVRTISVPVAVLIYPPQILKYLSFGFNDLFADILFIKAIGGSYTQEEGANVIYNTVKQVAELKGNFAYIYEFGSALLAWEYGQYARANELLELGLQKMPNSYFLAFYRAFNAFYFQSDYKSASIFFKLAATLTDNPVQKELCRKNAVIFALIDPNERIDPIPLLEELMDLSNLTDNKREIEDLLQQYKTIAFERHLVMIVNQFREFEKHFPGSEEEMIQKGYLKALPIDENGNRYQYDPKEVKWVLIDK